MDERYRLKVTAGPDYDPATHQIVPVNADQTLRIENEHAIVSLCVRIQDYWGYPEDSPPTHAYFQHPLHKHDQYSISCSIIFKHPVSGDDLVFGNDFDRPVRDRLPPGFNTALRIVKWTLDPAIDGDPYADKPYLYSPALATWNQFRIGDTVNKSDEVPTLHERVVEEGADGESATKIREEEMKIPADVDTRRKFFHDEAHRKAFVFEPGRLYWADFGNPYLGFSDFTLRLPRFHLHVMKYVNEKNHDLRYVLKNRATGEVYFVVLFNLILRGTDEEAAHVDRIEELRQESKEKHEQANGKLGKFEWEPEPSGMDVD